jgi:hypothetical protein
MIDTCVTTGAHRLSTTSVRAVETRCEAAGSPLRMRSRRERRLGKGAPRRARAGQVRRVAFSASCETALRDPVNPLRDHGCFPAFSTREETNSPIVLERYAGRNQNLRANSVR